MAYAYRFSERLQRARAQMRGVGYCPLSLVLSRRGREDVVCRRRWVAEQQERWL